VGAAKGKAAKLFGRTTTVCIGFNANEISSWFVGVKRRLLIAMLATLEMEYHSPTNDRPEGMGFGELACGQQFAAILVVAVKF
jgi:hypothetical protein